MIGATRAMVLFPRLRYLVEIDMDPLTTHAELLELTLSALLCPAWGLA